MISHLYIGVSDFDRAYRFYAALMDTLGLTLKFRNPDRPLAAWMQAGVPRPLFVIGGTYNGEAVDPGNGHMIALLASSRAIVDRAHATALAQGATCEGPPGVRPHYHEHYYGAYFRDLDGHKLCVACHDPVTESANTVR